MPATYYTSYLVSSHLIQVRSDMRKSATDVVGSRFVTLATFSSQAVRIFLFTILLGPLSVLAQTDPGEDPGPDEQEDITLGEVVVWASYPPTSGGGGSWGGGIGGGSGAPTPGGTQGSEGGGGNEQSPYKPLRVECVRADGTAYVDFAVGSGAEARSCSQLTTAYLQSVCNYHVPGQTTATQCFNLDRFGGNPITESSPPPPSPDRSQVQETPRSDRPITGEFSRLSTHRKELRGENRA